MTIEDPITVTRHPALVEYLIENGYIPLEPEVLQHATVADIKDRHVIGILPPSLAKHTAKVSEVPLNIPQEMRGKELTIEQVREYAGTLWSYTLREI